MAAPNWRYLAAVFVALASAFFVTVFARQTHDDYDLGLWIDATEWPVTLLFVASAWFAWSAEPRRAALATVAGLVAFYVVQWRHVFDVPLGFGVVTLLALAVILIMPPKWEGT